MLVHTTNGDDMKKIIIILSSILLVVCFLFPQEKELRIRVISNSNSESDLAYKYEVVEYFKEKVVPNITLTKEFFEENTEFIQDLFNQEFSNVTVSFEAHTFTNKTYNISKIIIVFKITFLILHSP